MVWLSQAERAACRPLLRLAKLADKQPARIATLLGNPPRLYNNKSGKTQQVEPGEWAFVGKAMFDLSGGATEYANPQVSTLGSGLFVCTLFHEPDPFTMADEDKNGGSGSTFTCPSTELQGTAGRPHEVWIASAGTRQTEGLMPQQFNLDGNSDADMVSLEELSPEALRQLQEDAAHSMENVYQRAPGGPIWRHRSCLPDTRSEGGSAGSLSDPWKLHQELKKGQALLISQAWDKHKRDQAARFGVRADRIRNALVREFEANMSSYVNDEVFVHAIDMATCLNPSSQSAPSTSSLKTSSLDGPFVSEVYTNTQRVMREASKRGHRVGTPLSLETGWNFLLADHREQAKQLIRKEKPYFLIFSPLMHLNPSTNLEEILEKGRVLMNFALELAAIQISSSCFSGVCFASRCLVFGSHTAQQLTKFVRKYGSTADQVCEKAWSNS
ncbi:Hypothetical protein SCF082_LOCUS44760 [Durusdinium trenchii]|uniref:Uncharacterized protein n=1 Tax=Durusdinium trenchii TaxID=1381693 RepID=A0ABP0R841_9DINO